MTMRYFSTKNQQQPYTFREAVLRGLPEDNGLFMPENIPPLSSAFMNVLDQLSLDRIGFEVLRHFTGEDIPETYLEKLTEETFNFPIPLIPVEPGIQWYVGCANHGLDLNSWLVPFLYHHFISQSFQCKAHHIEATAYIGYRSRGKYFYGDRGGISPGHWQFS